MDMPDYKDFTDAVAASEGQPERAYAALEKMVKDVVGVKLFTIMTSDTMDKLSERVYSNMPDVYPVYGTKPYHDNEWSEITLNKKQTFVANTIEDIAKVFNDHELILSLGLESVINVPVIVSGEVIGTLNCLHEKGYYTEERVRAAEALKLPGAVCMLMHSQHKSEEN